MSRGSEAFGGGVSRCLRCRKCRSGTFPAGQRFLPTILKFEHSCQPAFRIAESKQIALPLAFAGDLAPDRRRIPEITGELNAAGEALKPVQPRPLVLILGPQLQRAPEAACTVAVCVHRAKSVCC